MEFIPTGLVEGVLSSFGLYEECLAIESPEAKWNGVRGKYCIAKVKLPFMEPVFPGAVDVAMEEAPHKEVDLSQLTEYAKRRALFNHLGVDFEPINNKLKLLQMINHLNGSYYRIGACLPAPCTSEEVERAINKCKCSLTLSHSHSLSPVLPVDSVCQHIWFNSLGVVQTSMLFSVSLLSRPPKTLFFFPQLPASHYILLSHSLTLSLARSRHKSCVVSAALFNFEYHFAATRTLFLSPLCERWE